MKTSTIWLFCIIGVILWWTFGLLAAGMANKHFYSDDHWSSLEKCEDHHATDQSFAIMWGLLGGPFAAVVALGMTGFAHKGWTLAKQPCEDY